MMVFSQDEQSIPWRERETSTRGEIIYLLLVFLLLFASVLVVATGLWPGDGVSMTQRLLNQLKHVPLGYNPDDPKLKSIFLQDPFKFGDVTLGRTVFLEKKCPVSRCEVSLCPQGLVYQTAGFDHIIAFTLAHRIDYTDIMLN